MPRKTKVKPRLWQREMTTADPPPSDVPTLQPSRVRGAIGGERKTAGHESPCDVWEGARARSEAVRPNPPAHVGGSFSASRSSNKAEPI